MLFTNNIDCQILSFCTTHVLESTPLITWDLLIDVLQCKFGHAISPTVSVWSVLRFIKSRLWVSAILSLCTLENVCAIVISTIMTDASSYHAWLLWSQKGCTGCGFCSIVVQAVRQQCKAVCTLCWHAEWDGIEVEPGGQIHWCLAFNNDTMSGRNRRRLSRLQYNALTVLCTAKWL